MRAGRVEQAGTPEEVYRRPATRWMAEFLGDAEVLPGVAGTDTVECELGVLPTDRAARGAVDVVVRPERGARSSRPATGCADGAGRRAHVPRPRPGTRLRLPSGRELRSRSRGVTPWQVGDEVGVAVVGPVATFAPATDGTPA